MAGPSIVELSHVLIPGKSGRLFNVKPINAEAVAPICRLEDQWYIMHLMDMINHLGTHVEVPYHLNRTGADLTEQPVESFIGPMVCLDLRESSREPRHKITLQETQAAAEKAGGIRPGEIVFIFTGWDTEFATEKYLQSPFFEVKAIDWLAERGMKLLGIDSAGVESLESCTHECHYALFNRGLPLIENLANLGSLNGPRATVFAVPLAIKGLEAFPVRVIAFQ